MLFGKLVLIYSRDWVVSKLNGFETKRRYVVLATDEVSVAILIYGQMNIRNRKAYSPDALKLVDEFGSPPTIYHIHFDKRGYWISLGMNREFFRRIDGAKSTTRRAIKR